MIQGSRSEVAPLLDQATCVHNYCTYLRIISFEANVLGRIYFCPRCGFEYIQRYSTEDADPPTEGKY